MIQKKKKISACRSPRLIVCFGIVVLVIMFASVSAKYVQKKTEVEDTVSNEFYFTSTLLSETGTTYTLMPTVTELEIPVCNYADDLRYSAEQIQYSYTVLKNDKEISKGSGIIEAGELKTSSIKLVDLKAGTYEVTVTANSPFKKVLKGTFTIPEESIQVHYSVADKEDSPYLLFTVWTENYDGNVKLTWPENLIPDTTNAQLQNVDTYNSDSGKYVAGEVTLSYTAYSSKVYRFFKINPSVVYTENQFNALKTDE